MEKMQVEGPLRQTGSGNEKNNKMQKSRGKKENRDNFLRFQVR